MRPVRGWRVPVRVARRDALRSGGRSALIVAMIAIPVLGLGAVDVLYRTTQVDIHERVGLELGSKADAWVRLTNGDAISPIKQSVYAGGWSSSAASTDADAPTPKPPLPLAKVLPPGSQLALVSQGSASSTLSTDSDPSVSVTLADESNALVRGRYPFTGKAPANNRQLLASPGLMAWLHLHVGSDVELASSSDGKNVQKITYRIVGTLHDRDATSWSRAVLGLPGSVGGPAGTTGINDPNATWLVKVPGGLRWSQVLKLNGQGYLAFSRQVVAHPPAKADVPYEVEQGQSNNALSVRTLFGILVAVLVLGLALLEVGLLAGSAFAVGVRRQTRTVGLLSASGADSSVIRRVVLAQGLVLGIVAAVVGVPVAVLLARLALPLLAHLDRYTVYGPFDIRPLELLGIGAVAVVAGLAAATLPARTAARLDPVRALAGRRGQLRSPKRWPLIGLALAGFGAALSLAGAAWVIALYRDNTGSSSRVFSAATVLLVGAALVQIGLIIATPAIIGAAGHLASRLPLAPRFALRDASRNRGRTAPAVGAVLAAVAASSALTLYVASQDDHDRRHYFPTLVSGQGQVGLHVFASGFEGDRLVDAAVAQRTLAGTLPLKTSMVVRTVGCVDADNCSSPSFAVAKANECPLPEGSTLTQADTEKALRDLSGDWRCQVNDYLPTRFSGDPVAADGAQLLFMSGVRSAAADAMLRRGGVVVFRREWVNHGTVTIDIFQADGTQTSKTLPGLYVDAPNHPGINAIWSPAAVTQAGYVARNDSVLMTFTHSPTSQERKTANTGLRALGVPYNLYVETGYHSNYGPGLLALVAGAALVTLLATGVATGLSQADARPDHATLSAVGASPRVRRTLAGAQSWSLALLGTMLGVVGGLVPAIALMWARPDYNVIIPWEPLGLTLLVVPLLAGLGALALTRSRMPMGRRIT